MLENEKGYDRGYVHAEYSKRGEVYVKEDTLYRVRIENPILGVPITFLDKYNPAQFELVAFRKGDDGKDLVFTKAQERVQPYFRILIRRRLQTR